MCVYVCMCLCSVCMYVCMYVCISMYVCSRKYLQSLKLLGGNINLLHYFLSGNTYHQGAAALVHIHAHLPLLMERCHHAAGVRG